LYCAACCKSFRSQNAFNAHLSSKKHKQTVASLREQLLEDGYDNPDEILNLNKMELTEDVQKQNKKSKKKSEKNVSIVVNNADDIPNTPIIILSSKEDSPHVEASSELNDPKLKAAKKSTKKPQEMPPSSSEINKETDSNNVADSHATSNGGLPDDKKQATNTSQNCLVCGNTFASKNKLFLHIKETGHAILKSAGPSLEQQPRASASINGTGKSLKSKKNKTKR